MPGAGKSTVASALEEDGFIVLNMGDCVRSEAKKQKLEPTDQNLGYLMLKLRKELGPGAIAILIIDKIMSDYKNDSYSKFVIDGIRSVQEIEQLKRIGIVKILSIHGSIMTRFKHLKNRSRSDAPYTIEDCLSRDKRELSVGVSEAIAFADEIISNNEISLNQLKEQAKNIASNWFLFNKYHK
jgi:dephospho-CoA kinase